MANMGRRRYPMESLGDGRMLLEGTFRPNGSSAVSATTREGTTGWSVARTSAGLFTVTLEDVWYIATSKWCSLQLAAGSDKILQFGEISLSSKTVQLRVWDISDAAVADIADDANNKISFGLVLKRITTSVR